MEYLYVCHFSNGHIKVGRSIHPKSRIAVHADRVACIGVELVEHHIVECAGHSAPAETSLINQCAELATKRNKNEWFEGLDYLDVCEIADLASRVTHPDPVLRIMHKEITPAERKHWAELLGVNEQYLYQCLTGRRDMNPAEARRIEVDSVGVISRQMLCQKTWQGIWPELNKSV